MTRNIMYLSFIIDICIFVVYIHWLSELLKDKMKFFEFEEDPFLLKMSSLQPVRLRFLASLDLSYGLCTTLN